MIQRWRICAYYHVFKSAQADVTSGPSPRKIVRCDKLDTQETASVEWSREQQDVYCPRRNKSEGVRETIGLRACSVLYYVCLHFKSNVVVTYLLSILGQKRENNYTQAQKKARLRKECWTRDKKKADGWRTFQVRTNVRRDDAMTTDARHFKFKLPLYTARHTSAVPNSNSCITIMASVGAENLRSNSRTV